jgi:hypothetical protein
MGTITRTFANNITTSGVFKPTAFNNASFDNVTAVPEVVLLRVEIWFYYLLKLQVQVMLQ